MKLPRVSHGRLGWEDGNIWHLGSVTRWNSQFLIHTWTFLTVISVASQWFLCLFWISLWLKNRCLQHPCFKDLCKIAQASKNSDSNAQHETIWNNLHPFTNPSRLSWKIIPRLSDQIFNANHLILTGYGIATLQDPNLHFQGGHVTYRYGSMVTDMSISYNLICKSALEFLWIIKTRISTQTYRTRKKGLYVMKCEERNLQDPNLHIQGGHVTYLLDWYFEWIDVDQRSPTCPLVTI